MVIIFIFYSDYGLILALENHQLYCIYPSPNKSKSFIHQTRTKDQN